MSAQSSVSISKLKSELRQASRLLSKQGDKLNATLKVETERRVESLKAQIDEEQRRRGIDGTDSGPSQRANGVILNEQAPKSARSDARSDEPADSTSKSTFGKDKSKHEDKYKMLRHVEHVKTLRKVKQAERHRASLQTDLQNVPADDSKDSRRKLKALEKELKSAAQQLDVAKRDAWYTVTFPPQFKYVALYPAGSFIEDKDLPEPPKIHPSKSSQEALAIFVAQMPPARQPEEVRRYWRAVVTARVARGDLVGDVQKPKKLPKAGKESKGVNGFGNQANGADEVSEGDVVDEDNDDFFE